MANNLIQIKRTSVAGRAANTTTLPNAGQLALNMPDRIMYSTDGSTVFEIGANVDIQSVRTALYVGDNVDLTTTSLIIGNTTVNLVVTSTAIKISNSTQNTGITIPTDTERTGEYYLHANGTWAEVPGADPAGGNTYVQYNDSSQWGGSAGFTFDETTNNVLIANTLTIGISGNTINSTVFTGKSYTANSANNLEGYISTNSNGLYPQSNYVGHYLGNTISRWTGMFASADFIYSVVNSTGFHVITDTGSDWVNVIATGITIANNGNTITIRPPTTAQKGGSYYLHANGTWATVSASATPAGGNTEVQFNDRGVMNASPGFQFDYPTNTVNIANTLYLTNLYLSGALKANQELGTAGQMLTSNSGGGVYWSTPTGGGSFIATRVYESFTATAGQTVFTVSGGYDTGLIEVFYNGVHLANTEYTQNGSTVTLGTGALVGTVIEVAGFKNLGAGGSNTYVQYNDSTAVGGSAGFTFNETTNNVLVANTLTVGTATVNTTLVNCAAINLSGQINVGANSVVSNSVISSGGSLLSANVQTTACTGTSYTLLASDSGKVCVFSNASAVTVTIPAGLPIGYRTACLQTGAGAVTLSNTGQTGASIYSRTSAFAITAQYGSATVFQPTANVYIIDGSI